MSNTAFVPGCLIHAFLERQYSADVFSFELYSDEVHLAKPQLAMYDMCFAQVQLIHGDAVLRQNVLHAGDSLVNDVQAGIIAGMRTYAVYE
jgi:FMN phosphatase YigB (HAD superfamily)